MEGCGRVVRIRLETSLGRVLAAGIVVEIGQVLKLETQRSPALLKLGARSNAAGQLELGGGGRTRNLISQGHSAIEELGLKGLVGERVKGLLRGGDWGFGFEGLGNGGFGVLRPYSNYPAATFHSSVPTAAIEKPGRNLLASRAAIFNSPKHSSTSIRDFSHPPMTGPTIFLLLPIVFLLFSVVHPSSSPNTDLKPLMAFKSKSDTSKRLISWNYSTSLCSWFGVLCNLNHRVWSLDLVNLSLHGSFEPLTLLDDLLVLNLNGNRLSGPIPNLSNLTRLQILILSHNQLGVGTVRFGPIFASN
ncbi:hypothetical protein L3X38_005349 [Prunus dulcis]|uniref:Leucine-rich repeat-containing N-terminal plant-type domain-containing protein n=1 Tax=Prunus dulcis TaxID=3755 RepID=A0AAD5F454_PRUDU|nr:hypothetical protein L3X38_005349 [Prunus dulcis]